MNATTTYPEAPGWKATETETSRKAAFEERVSAGVLREQAERILKQFENCTADEAAMFLGVSPFAMRPRFSELVAQGKAEDSGVRRRNASGKSAVAWRWKRELKQEELL